MPRRRRAAGGGGGRGADIGAGAGAAAAAAAAALADDEPGCCARPEQRHAANARERARMRVLARAFCRLKTTLPWVPADTKLSKLDTLRLAASYIAHLRAILTDEPAPPSAQHPLNLTWPFSFQQQTASAPAAPAPAPAQPHPAPALPPPAGGGAELQCAVAPGWPPATCRPHLPPSPSSSCSADGDGDADADLDEDDCPLFHRQHQLQHHHHHHLQQQQQQPHHHHHHHHHQQNHPQLQSHVAHLPYSDAMMHLG
ncbi:neurogenic differentiation factor 1-like [Schistocerca gregaria]|uniref:neurogenic differentiation factor 1-like n=1 Tax=Schistocerca gregaria TaxID=7010 RepID=UPI00211EB09B|nr:neurogenic differentiation factor 1-like [Schistocerca gregaria]